MPLRASLFFIEVSEFGIQRPMDILIIRAMGAIRDNDNIYTHVARLTKGKHAIAKAHVTVGIMGNRSVLVPHDLEPIV
jgi:hypothetical protein